MAIIMMEFIDTNNLHLNPLINDSHFVYHLQMPKTNMIHFFLGTFQQMKLKGDWKSSLLTPLIFFKILVLSFYIDWSGALGSKG